MGLVKPDPSDSVHIDLNPGQASTLAGILERFSETGSLVDALGHVGLKYETADWYTKRLKTSYCCSELIFWVHYGRLYLSAADFRYENHIIFTKSSARFISGILYGTPLHIVREFNLRMQKSLDG